MNKNILKVHPADNVIVALHDLKKGDEVEWEGRRYILDEDIPAKHKFTQYALEPGGQVFMYGVLVGKAQVPINAGARISVANVKHASMDFALGERKLSWHVPDTANWAGKTFNGYHRSDGSVGTANHWIVIPMVFCENRNIDVLKETLLDELGFGRPKKYHSFARQLKNLYSSGKTVEEILNAEFKHEAGAADKDRLFANIDGVKFITHEGGCGGTRQDAQALCGLLAGYITHPNVAGATVLSLGCQNAQVSMLEEEIAKRYPILTSPYTYWSNRRSATETDLISQHSSKLLPG